MRIKSRDLSLIITFASLYAILVYALPSISFHLLQFRVAGILRPSIAKKRILVIGYAMGVIISNLVSPFVGIYELLFMPIMSIVAGLLGYSFSKRYNGNYFVAGFVIATVISISLSWMFMQLFGFSFLVSFSYTFLSEQIICFMGACIFKTIEKRWVWW